MTFKPFTRIKDELQAENVPLQTLAQTYGTPLYVYSKTLLEANYQAFDQAFSEVDHQVCFAVKANSNLGVLGVLAKLGSGFDIVSGGELKRVLAAGGDAAKVVFSGLGKSHADIELALRSGIACFNVESEAELKRISEVAARMNMPAPISLRVNPDVDAQTHPYISTGLKENKFGVPFERALELYTQAKLDPFLEVVGVDCHIGSQLTSTQAFEDALGKMSTLIAELKDQGIALSHIDIGGGLGVCYQDETPPTPHEYAQALLPTLNKLGLKVYMEPGRAIAAKAGLLLTRVDILKPTEFKNFAVVDAAMNDLIRPALYQSWMDVQPVSQSSGEVKTWDIVGAICETGDWLAKDRKLALEHGDLLAIMDAGAYGFVMASNYNTRGRAAEVMVSGSLHQLVRARETAESLWDLERCYE